jgi:hypothetical protein
MGHHTGSIRYNTRNGHVVIAVPGYYFIYSQLYYFDSDTYHLSHGLYINERKVMASSSSVFNSDTKYNSNYNGGLFFLKERDNISLRVTVHGNYNMDPGLSYFGAFFMYTGDGRN